MNVSGSLNIDLTGGLLVSDYVKYALPSAFSLTMLAWSMLQYPQVGRARWAAVM